MYNIDQEYNLWLQQQADLLRKGKFEALDLQSGINIPENTYRKSP
jgi:hypothetical protein